MEFFADKKTATTKKNLVKYVSELPRFQVKPPKNGSIYNKIKAMVNEGVLMDFEGIIQPNSWKPDDSSVIS